MANAVFWDRIARKYASDPIKDPDSYEYTLARSLSYLKSTDRVLELGCGTGSTALRVAPSVGEVVASDFSGGMIEIANEKLAAKGHQNLRFVQAPAMDAGQEDGPFDAVMAFNLIHLLPRPKDHIAAMAARLKPGGFLITKTPCLSKRAWLFGPMIAVMRLFGKAPGDLQFISFGQYDDWIREAGLEILETDVRPEPFSRYVVARKP